MAWKGLGASVQPTQGAPRGEVGGEKRRPHSLPSGSLPGSSEPKPAGSQRPAGRRWAALRAQRRAEKGGEQGWR